jgi:rubredoxin
MPLRVQGSVKCPHCLVMVFRPARSWQVVGIEPDQGDELVLESFKCPSCDKPVVAMLKGKGIYAQRLNPARPEIMSDDTARWVVFPRSYSRPVAPEVPDTLADDYREAAAVLELSPKASAALGRRCLQNTIRQVANIQHPSLVDEIKDLIGGGLISSGLATDLDAVRKIGNFAAHPMKDTQTGMVLDVEPVEAEWTLDLLDRLFDEIIVQPATSAARKQALNAKLKAAGKPEIP